MALVAGATRGAGRGIAVQLGAAGATVYATGRSTRRQRSEYDRPDTIEDNMPLIDRLTPDLERDVYVLKPMLSGFYNTSLDALLASLGAERLILTGFAGNICVFFTANDAHMRGYDVLVPSDCVASERREDNEYALAQMRKVLSVDTRPSPQLALVPQQRLRSRTVGLG